MIGSSGATRRSTIRSITSRSWRASPARCATERPSRDWDLPPALRRVQRKLERQPGGDRQVVEILGAVLTDGWTPSKPPAPRRWRTTSIPPASF
jgi:hypothetical protein